MLSRKLCIFLVTFLAPLLVLANNCTYYSNDTAANYGFYMDYPNGRSNGTILQSCLNITGNAPLSDITTSIDVTFNTNYGVAGNFSIPKDLSPTIATNCFQYVWGLRILCVAVENQDQMVRAGAPSQSVLGE